MPETPDVDATVRRIEALVAGQPEAGELVQLLMQLYGAGLARVLDMIRREGAEALLERFAADKLVATLLLLHGLHPVDAETRVAKALRTLERHFESERLVLAAIKDGVAYIRVERSGGGTPAPSLAESIERAALEAAPELDGVEIEGASPAALVQIAPAGSAHS